MNKKWEIIYDKNSVEDSIFRGTSYVGGGSNK